MEKHIQDKLEEMRDQQRGKSFEQISSIGWDNQEPIFIKNKKYYPAVWSQKYGEKEVLLVVQITKWHLWRFFGTTDCIGFIQDQSGKTIDVDSYWLMHEIGHP